VARKTVELKDVVATEKSKRKKWGVKRN